VGVFGGYCFSFLVGGIPKSSLGGSSGFFSDEDFDLGIHLKREGWEAGSFFSTGLLKNLQYNPSKQRCIHLGSISFTQSGDLLRELFTAVDTGYHLRQSTGWISSTAYNN